MRRPPRRPLLAGSLLLLLAACAATAPRPASPPAATASPTPAAVAAPQLPDDVGWVLRSAEYRAACAQAYALAVRRIEELAQGHQAGTWAVALDVDETVLSNVQYEIEMLGKGVDFDDPSWRAWIARREAPVLPGVVAFLERVHSLGGRVALVTDRDEDQRADIEANLRAQGVPFDLLLPRPRPGQGDKQPRWDAVEKGTAAPGVPPLAILLFVGDNIKDFPGLDQSVRDGGAAALAPFGDRFVVLPNPMYGSWKGAAPQPMASPKP